MVCKDERVAGFVDSNVIEVGQLREGQPPHHPSLLPGLCCLLVLEGPVSSKLPQCSGCQDDSRKDEAKRIGEGDGAFQITSEERP